MNEAITELADWQGLIGLEAPFAQLCDLRMKQLLPSVILFTGPEGMGKRRLLAKLAAATFCRTSNSCGTCLYCIHIASGEHNDVLWMGGGETLNVEHANEIQEHLQHVADHQHGSRMGKRLVVILDAERMTRQCANKLLKTLEEPPADAEIWLTTSSAGRLLETVRSRCTRWRLPPPNVSESSAWLQKKANDASIKVSKEEIEQALQLVGCATGAAWRLIEEQRNSLSEKVASWLIEQRVDYQLEMIQNDTRGAKIAPGEMLTAMEVAMNQLYRSRQVMVGGVAVQERRELLSKVRKLVLKDKVAVNVQLMAEAMVSSTWESSKQV
jgi:DNA polymerase III gamma/tau subunit